MRQIENVKWATKNIHGILNPKQFGIETRLDITDTDFTIYQISISNPDGKTVSTSFCSFNHDAPHPSSLALKPMVNRLIFQLKTQLSEYSPQDGIPYAEKLRYQEKFTVKFTSRKSGYSHWYPNNGENEDKYNAVCFAVRKNLLLWFWQYGEKMFELEIIKTPKKLQYNSYSMGDNVIHIAQAYWIFPWNMNDTSDFLGKMLDKFVAINSIYYLTYIPAHQNHHKNWLYHHESYHWIPSKYKSDTMIINCRKIVSYHLTPILRNAFDAHFPDLMPTEMIHHIIHLFSDRMIEWYYYHYFKDRKIEQTIQNVEIITLTQAPVPFFESKDKVIKEGMLFNNGTQNDIKLSHQKCFIVVEK